MLRSPSAGPRALFPSVPWSARVAIDGLECLLRFRGSVAVPRTASSQGRQQVKGFPWDLQIGCITTNLLISLAFLWRRQSASQEEQVHVDILAADAHPEVAQCLEETTNPLDLATDKRVFFNREIDGQEFVDTLSVRVLIREVNGDEVSVRRVDRSWPKALCVVFSPGN